MSEQRCIHCDAPVRVTNYALGEEVEHYDPDASFPTRQRGTAWRYCHLSVATLPAAMRAQVSAARTQPAEETASE